MTKKTTGERLEGIEVLLGTLKEGIGDVKESIKGVHNELKGINAKNMEQNLKIQSLNTKLADHLSEHWKDFLKFGFIVSAFAAIVASIVHVIWG